jgi:hypothetical protein
MADPWCERGAVVSLVAVGVCREGKNVPLGMGESG